MLNRLSSILVEMGLPTLGGAVAGPAGAAAGRIIAEAIGVASQDPDVLADAITGDPDIYRDELEHLEHDEAILALRDIEVARADNATAVNETMRVEMVSGSRYKSGWRPLYGWLTTLEFALWGYGLFAIFAFMVVIGRFGELLQLMNAATIMAGYAVWYIAARLAVLGVYVSGRTQEKKAAMTGRLPSTLVDIIRSVIAR